VRIGAWDGQELRLSDSLPARLGSDGWNFVVVHVVPAGHPLEIGANAIVEVDEKHRYGLSSGHTACHLAALALNDALAVHWSKDVRRDSLGTPDFDGAAIQRSTIRPYGAADTYRLGKSLRKSGFGADDALARLPEIEERVNTRLAEWIGADSPVHIRRASDLLSERRFWVCALPDATATIPCGGTHITNLAELRAATIQLTIDDSRSTLTMTTSVAATD
jgi:alanyl-tRNA synthetase